jgi:hypothetical protein
MATTFRSLRKFAGPPWLVVNGDSAAVGYVLDALKDAFVDRLEKGLLARFPQQGPDGSPAADDALAAMGRDRRIKRGIFDTSAAYALRLLRWLDDWKVAGNPYALMQQLAAYLGPSVSLRTVDARGNWYSRAADGTLSVNRQQGNWDWSGQNAYDVARWSRFWVIIYPNGLWQPGPKWGDAGAKWGTPGRTWGSTATSEQVASVRSLVADWKPAGTRCVNIIVAFDNTSFDPTQPRDGTGLPNGLWSLPSYTNGSNAQAPSRLATARYWDGV